MFVFVQDMTAIVDDQRKIIDALNKTILCTEKSADAVRQHFDFLETELEKSIARTRE